MDVGVALVAAVVVAFAVLVALVVRKMARGELHAPAEADRLGPGETAESDEALAREALGEPEPEASRPTAPATTPAREAGEPAGSAKDGAMRRGLEKTRKGFMARINDLLFKSGKLDEGLVDELEEILIGSDIGVRTAEKLIGDLRGELTRKEISDPEAVRARLRAKIGEIVGRAAPPVDWSKKPTVIMVIGVNGVGKTTTIGKIAARLSAEGKKVVLAAGDTFRAAAVEQLEIWSQRAGVELVRGQEKADPSAVVFSAIQRAQALGADACICDTAGRLHTKVNLMEELKKLKRSMHKAHPGAPHEVLLVLDATTGQNAINQAKQFKEAVEVDALALTKLDGTAKGGVVVAICDDLGIPVRYVGVGEKVEDLRDFDPTDFVDALFAREA